jgi:guanine deaminase
LPIRTRRGKLGIRAIATHIGGLYAPSYRSGHQNVRTGRGGPFAALVVNDGRVVAEGANRVTSSNDPTAHAEIVAIREASRVLNEFDDAFIYEELKQAASERRIPMKQILQGESMAIFYAWAQQETKQLY